jgi:HAD superfamily hydrolase (TIGR01509 family)
MDGTLTVAIHDFEAIRNELGLPPGRPILETLAALPFDQAARLRQRLDDIELQLAFQALPQAGAADLLIGLRQRGGRLGILTRNSRRNAQETLRRCGLLDLFEPDCILGREAAAPKPSPDGVRQLLARWGARPDEAVMVGDYRFDLEAGRGAGTATVYIDLTGAGEWSHLADVTVGNLAELMALAVT